MIREGVALHRRRDATRCEAWIHGARHIRKLAHLIMSRNRGLGVRGDWRDGRNAWENTTIGQKDELVVVGTGPSKLQRRRHGNRQASLEAIVLATGALVLDVHATKK